MHVFLVIVFTATTIIIISVSNIDKAVYPHEFLCSVRGRATHPTNFGCINRELKQATFCQHGRQPDVSCVVIDGE